jgi:hypothetical protein
LHCPHHQQTLARQQWYTCPIHCPLLLVKDVPLFPSLADDVRKGGKVPFILGIRVPVTHMLKITAAVHTAVEMVEMIEVIPLQILVKTT